MRHLYQVGRNAGVGGLATVCVVAYRDHEYRTGALDHEPVYRGPFELADDVAIAASCGVTDLTLFDLGGVMRRGPAEAWLEAFIAPPSAEVRGLDGEGASFHRRGRRELTRRAAIRLALAVARGASTIASAIMSPSAS